jgi:hypothetical protein
VTSNAVKPAPSILAADFAYRGDQVADHQLAEKSEHLPLEALLMISNPVSLSMNLCRPGPIHFWSAGRATIICRACKASKRWENGSASPLTRRLARPFWSRSCKTSRPGAGHDGEPWIRTSALPSRDAPEDQACAPDDRANQTGVQPRGGRRDRRDQCPRWRLPRESTWWWPDRRFSITGKESSPHGTAAGRNTALIGKDVVQLAMIGLDRCQDGAGGLWMLEPTAASGLGGWLLP